MHYVKMFDKMYLQSREITVNATDNNSNRNISITHHPMNAIVTPNQVMCPQCGGQMEYEELESNQFSTSSLVFRQECYICTGCDHAEPIN